MQYGTIGNSNIKASKVILGTWQAGKTLWVGIDDKETTKAIRGAIDLGINTIDTAAGYGDGHSEQIIAAALQDLARDKYYLATKVFSDKLQYHHVLKECEKSLKNLNTDYIDLYQIHWPAGSFNSEVIPIHETMEALIELKNAGKIRHIGVSNFSKTQLEEALQYGDIVSNQPPYSLIWRPYDKETNPFCRQNNIAILAYSPLAQGILTGKFGKNHIFQPGDHRSRNKLMIPDNFDRVQKVLDGLRTYADKYNTTIGNISLNWLISQPLTFVIVGARNLSQVQDNVTCCDFQLTPTEITEIDELSKIVTKHMNQDNLLWSQ